MAKYVKPILLALVLSAAVGCAAPSASLDLISVARKAVAAAEQAEDAQHAELMRLLSERQSALDAAFDADVALVAAGQIRDATGEPVALTPEWVVSARKGYAAARDLVAADIRSAEKAHATRMDNLQAGDQALDMASQLIVRQWSVSEQIRQRLIESQRRLAHE